MRRIRRTRQQLYLQNFGNCIAPPFTLSSDTKIETLSSIFQLAYIPRLITLFTVVRPMILRGKRVRSLTRHLATIVPPNTAVVFAIPAQQVTANLLQKIGLPVNADLNSAVLPSPIFGPTSVINAEGGEIIHRDQPIETVTHMVYTTWHDWHGYPHSGFVSRSYRRYPRTKVPAPAVELKIAATTSGDRLIITDALVYEPANHSSILHTINLFLEIFGECHVLTSNLDRIIRAPVRRLNWNVLPRGIRPWAQLEREIQPLISRATAEHQPIIRFRLEAINRYQPDFVAVGIAGFTGYIIFGFPQRRFFVLESIHLDNATYVFGEDWERLSQMTKAEILDQQLAIDRFIHNESWPRRLAGVFA